MPRTLKQTLFAERLFSVYFRFLKGDGTPTGWVGLAIAPTIEDLFWKIDEFGDPYSVELARVNETAVCLEVVIPFPNQEDEGTELRNIEVSELFPTVYNEVYYNGLVWFKPTWPKIQ